MARYHDEFAEMGKRTSSAVSCPGTKVLLPRGTVQIERPILEIFCMIGSDDWSIVSPTLSSQPPLSCHFGVSDQD